MLTSKTRTFYKSFPYHLSPANDLLCHQLSYLAIVRNCAELSSESAFPSDHRLLPSVISVDDVLVFEVARELEPYNTQQTTAKLTQNTSCSVFLCCSSCLPHWSAVSCLRQISEIHSVNFEITNRRRGVNLLWRRKLRAFYMLSKTKSGSWTWLIKFRLWNGYNPPWVVTDTRK